MASSSCGTLHLSPSIIVLVHIESSGFNFFCLNCRGSSFRDNIFARAVPPALILRLVLSRLLVLTVNLLARLSFSFDVKLNIGSDCSGSSPVFCSSSTGGGDGDDCGD
ncbi:hypothetical protein ACHQM5_001767 [Ranunculus cassubicifolius]